ncbi:MAG TPA: hypothetical protein PLD75_04760 [Spirochaetota bacterium]|nr:hypothetical protein [Spirochaetota bacterium]
MRAGLGYGTFWIKGIALVCLLLVANGLLPASCVAPFTVVSTTGDFRAAYDAKGNMVLQLGARANEVLEWMMREAGEEVQDFNHTVELFGEQRVAHPYIIITQRGYRFLREHKVKNWAAVPVYLVD